MFILFADADCGRGYTLIEDHCYNVSIKAAPKDQIADVCALSDGVPLVTVSKKSFYYLRVITDSGS